MKIVTQQELLVYLHQYTPWELLHLKNINKLQEIESVNLSSDFPVSERDKTYGLHLPHTPDKQEKILSKAVFFAEQTEQDIMIVQHDRYTPPDMHKHDFFELIYVYEGEFVQQVNMKKLLMRTGDFCLIPPNVYHALDVPNYSVVLNILIPYPIFQHLALMYLQGNTLFTQLFANNRKTYDYLLFHTNGDLKIQQIVLDMCLEALNKANHYNELLKSYMITLLCLLSRYYGTDTDVSMLGKKTEKLHFLILQYMEKYFRTLTLQQVADEFHYTPQYLSYLIKQITGLSYKDYILQKKMQSAAELLRHTTMNIRAIALDIGYENPEHFNRTFRKQFGMTPGEYRKIKRIVTQ